MFVSMVCLLLGLSPLGEPATPPGVDLVIQTDSRGELVPCHCPGLSSGGLSRRSELFKLARNSGRPTLVLEGGDFLPDPDDSLAVPLTAFLPEVLPIMGYDVMGLGERELFRGPEFVAGLGATLPLVCANVTFHGRPAAPLVRWFETGGLRVAVTGFVDPLLFYSWPGAFDWGPDGILVRDPAEALTALEATLDSADVVVVLAHAELDRILEWAPNLGFVDVFVHGHEPELGEHPGRAGAAFVVEPGPRSRTVVRARVEIGTAAADGTKAKATPRGVVLSELHVWDLKRATRFDSRVETRVQSFLEALGDP